MNVRNFLTIITALRDVTREGIVSITVTPYVYDNLCEFAKGNLLKYPSDFKMDGKITLFGIKINKDK